MGVTPGVVVDGKLVTNDLVEINLGIRILLGHSFYDDWEDQEMFVTTRPAREPGRPPPPVEPAHRSRSRRSATSTTSTAGSCRRAGSTAPTTSPSTPAAARSPACGRRRCRASSTPTTSRRPATACEIHLPKTALKPEVDLRVEDPAVVEHDRARPGPHLLPGVRGGRRARLHREGAGRRARRQDQDVGAVRGARRGHRLRLHRGGPRRAVAPHGDQGRQDRQLPPVPADAVERQPARRLRHARARTRTR